MIARFTVTRRVIASYAVLLTAFAATMGLGYRDMRAAALEAELLRDGLVPLQLSIGQALAEQNVLATQLNHATAAKNPADVRDWIETARRSRPITLRAAKTAAQHLDESKPDAKRLRDEVMEELDGIDERQRADGDAYDRLFEALAAGDRARADTAQNELVKFEADTAQRLRAARSRTEATMERLGEAAQRREQRAIQLLVGLSAATLIVGLGISLYARRMLRPLRRVTERARDVAAGDLTPRAVADDGSEIGQLAETFEGMVGAIRDARSELVKAERLAAIGKMAAHITHEIRNPLSAIGLNLELLEGELEQSGEEGREQRELVSAIKNEATRLSRLSEQYLSLARRPKPTFAEESITELCEELAAFVRPEMTRAKVELVVDAEPDLPSIKVDESLLRQALVNLLRNAREAMLDGGELRLVIRAASGGGVDVLVEDDGPGIPDDVRASVFDPFFTTKQRGTGLGLAVTREIIEAHGGAIACEPRDGGGTRFVIHLPG